MQKPESSGETEEEKSLGKHWRHPFMIPVITFLVFFFIGLGLFIGFNGQTVGASDSRIVILTIDGQQREVIPTTANTVGDLINRLKISLKPGDIVEPSKNTPILENNFEINIYRAHPVTVIEGSQKQIIETASNNPRAIATEAGFTTYPEDSITFSQSPPINQSILGPEVVIIPSVPVSLDLYGQVVKFRTIEPTVGALLNSKKIPISGNNVLPAPSTPITTNMQILVVPVGQQLISTQQTIPYGTQTNPDPSIPLGTNTVVQQGVNGLELVVYEKSTNGAQKPIQTIVIDQPIPEIINHGTGITLTGNSEEWLKSSDIDPSNYSYVDYIMNHETHWNPDDVNPYGCIGLGQSCGNPPPLEVNCPDWQNDAVCQLNFFNAYAYSHWGGWGSAYYHEVSYGWW